MVGFFNSELLGKLVSNVHVCEGILYCVNSMYVCGESVRSWCDGSSDRSFVVDRLNYFSFQPVHHDWFNISRDMYYPVCGVMHITESLLLIGKCNPYSGSGFPLSLSEWCFTICVTADNRKLNVLCASLNKTVPFFISFTIKKNM